MMYLATIIKSAPKLQIFHSVAVLLFVAVWVNFRSFEIEQDSQRLSFDIGFREIFSYFVCIINGFL